MRQHWHHVLLLAAVVILALTFCAPAAQATEVWKPFQWLKYPKPPKVPPPVKAAPPVSEHGQRFICWANPAGVLICAVVVGIVVEETVRIIDGPACATMKPRRSLFGMVQDTPRLWRKLCDWPNDPAAPATVALRW